MITDSKEIKIVMKIIKTMNKKVYIAMIKLNIKILIIKNQFQDIE